MKLRTLGRMCILKHSILALERAPNMYRAPSTSREPLPAVQELSANCIVYVSTQKIFGYGFVSETYPKSYLPYENSSRSGHSAKLKLADRACFDQLAGT